MRRVFNGYIVRDNDKWLYDYFEIGAVCPNDLRNMINENPEGEELVLEVNSPGGSVYAGQEMYSILKTSDVDSVVEIQSIAASAMTYLSCAADKCLISRVGVLMVHLPSGGASGDKNDLEAAKNQLISIEKGVLNAYEDKCSGKATRSELKAMIQKTTFLSAEEAISTGFCDGYIEDEGDMPVMAMGMPTVASLQARYDKIMEQKQKDEAWTETAKMQFEIEKIRY